MKRRSSLRAPFVLTITASTALGCGASVTPSPTPPGDASVDADTGPSPDREGPIDRPWVIETDVHRACPVTLPAEGSACTPGVDPETCHDPSRTPPGCPSGVGVTMRCDPSTQRWQQLPIICNPPPVAQCPPSAPSGGSPCPPGTYTSAPLRCEYDRCGSYFATLATCEGPTAQWSVQQSSCNPPAPVDAGSAPTDI